jgi:hypothetical protein
MTYMLSGMLYSLVKIYRIFRDAHCLHHQGRQAKEGSMQSAIMGKEWFNKKIKDALGKEF